MGPPTRGPSNHRIMNVPLPYMLALRQIRYLGRYLRAFMWVIVANPRAMCRKTERTIIWGKIRRTIIVCVPGLALHLKRKHRLTGACISCGVSCNLLFKCPHWDKESQLCSIYDDRPLTCRLFPITPSDIRDRDLASSGTPCGYSFVPKVHGGDRSRNSDSDRWIGLQPPTSERQYPRQVLDSRRIVRSDDAAD
jgi:Fe-S-cluster containining protein